ncbi:heterokaryon incompatibility protein-domain-containing protein [Dendryphion nanum]|uniref:Heterokaryon incompatibility protein-domain-containing protein n=1 Tax=Dendryphion nanum TaxID=256645 RepID=A0A9P9DIR9_9PLEO|nr:heterokaryon incompatibility protein-domain-containing protein [Dendryphion nanum]
MSSHYCSCKRPDVWLSGEIRSCLSCGETILERPQARGKNDLEPQVEKQEHGALYQSLNYQLGQEIRVIILYGGEYSEPLKCDLTHVNLADNPTFEAVSYTWAIECGDTTLSEELQCGDQTIPITKSCDDALRQVRRKIFSRNIWVDAICINQSNTLERNHQVGLMDKIYHQAQQVLICLRDPHHDYGNFLAWLRQPFQHGYNNARIDSELRKLLSLRWFSRVWVIQEFALSRNPILYLSGTSVPLTPSRLQQMRELCISYHLTIPAPFEWNPSLYNQKGLLHCLSVARTSSSTDARDKVYGLLSLMDDPTRSLIQVDYSKTAEELYTEVAVAHIKDECTLDLLIHVGHDIKSNSASSLILPSWVPDWSKTVMKTDFPHYLSHNGLDWRSVLCFQSTTQSSEVNCRVDFMNAGEIDPLAGSSKQARLRIRAHYTDTIFDPGISDSFKFDASIVAENMMNKLSMSRIQEEWVLALFTDSDNQTDWQPNLETNHPCHSSTGDMFTNTSTNKKNSSATTTSSFNLESLYLKPAPFHTRRRESYIYDKWHCSSPIRQNGLIELLQFAIKYGKDANLFKSRHSIGFIKCISQPGDRIYFLDGARYPYILRNRGDGTYTMAGPCYLWAATKLDCWNPGSNQGRLGVPTLCSPYARTSMIEIY